MEKKLKKQWIKALRSGDYDQTQYALYDGEGYCCLGVLCDVAGAHLNPVNGCAFLGSVVVHDDGTVRNNLYSYTPIAGLSELARAELVKMNDAGVDFDIIADFIEECL